MRGGRAAGLGIAALDDGRGLRRAGDRPGRAVAVSFWLLAPWIAAQAAVTWPGITMRGFSRPGSP
jgi:hypothetical protein